MSTQERAIVSIIGAGSLRCGAYVLGSLLQMSLPKETYIHLYDANKEALDLFERLTNTFATVLQKTLYVGKVDSLDLALEHATHVVLCFGIGEKKQKLCDIEARFKLPKELHSLSRAVLLNDFFEEINEHIRKLGNDVYVINLVRPINYTAHLLDSEALHLDWPEQKTEAEKVSEAHRILRWIRLDEYPYEMLKHLKEGPLFSALQYGVPSAENRYSPKALAEYLNVLERIPGLGDSLLKPL